MTALVIGIDPHSRIHVAAAVDEHGRPMAGCEVGASPEQLGQLMNWIADLNVAKVAVEGSKGYGLPLARLLVAAGYLVVDVSSNLTAAERKRSGAAARTTRVTRWQSPASLCASPTCRP